MTSRSANAAMQSTYDAFKRYVEGSCRGDDNPQLTVERYGNLGKEGVTHMPIRLENVIKGTIKLHKLIEEFKKGSELRTEETQTGSMRYIADIPYQDPPQQPHQPGPPRPYDYYPAPQSDGPPAIVLQILIFSLLGLVIVYMYNFSS